MEKILYLILSVFVLTSCAERNGDTEKNIAIVEKYILAVEEMDYETMASLLDENYVGLGPSHTDSTGKEQALANWKYNLENLYESIQYTREQNSAVHIKDGPNKGEWISSWAELKIRFQDQRSVIIWANTAYKIKDDKIIKTITFYNEADALRQLGNIIINPNSL